MDGVSPVPNFKRKYGESCHSELKVYPELIEGNYDRFSVFAILRQTQDDILLYLVIQIIL